MRKLETDARHLYELRKKGDNKETDDSRQVSYYNRYELSDEKSFQSLFFQEKDSLLSVIDHFQNKTGKYAVPGYPHKLGLLLHGPPGTGKTSLIKALAQYTGRSIVNVPLTQIATNNELMQIMFQNAYHIQGQHMPAQLSFKDVIFVMEDVDAAAKIVHRRDGKRPDQTSTTSPEWVTLPAPKSPWQMLLESNNGECRKLVQWLLKKSDRLRQVAIESDALESVARRMNSIPGLSLVGESNDDEAIERVKSEARDTASKQMEARSTVDRYMGSVAQTIQAMLDSDLPISDAFEDELLGMVSSTPCLHRLSPGSDQIPKSYEDTMNGGSHVASKDVRFAEEKKIDLEDGKPLYDKHFGTSLWTKAIPDELNLTGLLNVLDGVVDTPGRILIITTNHPEMLDPALVRSGRVDKKLFLGYMRWVDMVHMLEHYYQTALTSEQKLRIEAVVAPVNGGGGGLQLTPAEVEQMTAEHDEVDDLLNVLEAREFVLQFRAPYSATPPTGTTSPASSDEQELQDQAPLIAMK